METKPNYTLAPWHLIHSDGQLRVDSERDGAVAVCHTLMRGEFKMPSECIANARLISAAPDLLKALKALISTARTFRNVPKDEQEWTSIDDDALEAAFDAIAKATGVQP